MTQLPLRVQTDVAEALSHYITELQADYALTFDECVQALRGAVESAHSDDDMPGGGYIVIT